MERPLLQVREQGLSIFMPSISLVMEGAGAGQGGRERGREGSHEWERETEGGEGEIEREREQEGWERRRKAMGRKGGRGGGETIHDNSSFFLQMPLKRQT